MVTSVNRSIVAPMAIVVMGVSGSGKSTLGALIAARLGCSFVEGDAFHDAAAVAMMRSGQPLGDDDRWPWLDRIGKALAAEVSANGVAVVACSALKRVYRDRLSGCVSVPIRFMLLDADSDTLRERLSERAGHYMPPSLLASQLAILERPADDEAALTLDTATPPEALAQIALEWLACPVAALPLQRSRA